MWIMLNDAFLSIVKKDCPAEHLLVRARRPGDIERVFGRRVKVKRATDADYLFRAVIPREDVWNAIQQEVLRINYGNFKDSVEDKELHDAYLRVWTAMAATQDPPPYSETYNKYPPKPWQRDGETWMGTDATLSTKGKGYTTGEYLELPLPKGKKGKG